MKQFGAQDMLSWRFDSSFHEPRHFISLIDTTGLNPPCYCAGKTSCRFEALSLQASLWKPCPVANRRVRKFYTDAEHVPGSKSFGQ